jgi:AraC-like DNA-binding protein/ligand-binding sensor protein
MARPLDLLFDDEVQKLFDHFSLCFDIRIVFFSAEGAMLRVGLNSPNTTFCHMIQEHLYGLKRCLRMDETHREEAAESRTLLCYQCHAGLNEAVKPIYVDQHLIGYVMIGQFRTSRKIPAQVLSDWKARHGDPRELVRAYNALTLLPPDRVDHVLGLFSIMIEYIMSQHMILLRGNAMLQGVQDYIRDHITEPLSLGEVARAAGRSPSSISHLFRERLGTTFRQTVIECRLRKAEECMTKVPGITVREAAYQSGFDDPAYFSRIYAKVRGVPPSVFLRNARQA